MANKWIVRDVLRKIERVGEEYDIDTFDCVFDTFEEAQTYLLKLLKADHAQAVADISRLSIELTAIEAKIRIINTSTEQDYIV